MDEQFAEQIRTRCPHGTDYRYKHGMVQVRHTLPGKRRSECPIVLHASVRVVCKATVLPSGEVEFAWGSKGADFDMFRGFDSDTTVDTSIKKCRLDQFPSIVSGNNPNKIMQSVEVPGSGTPATQQILLHLCNLLWC